MSLSVDDATPSLRQPVTVEARNGLPNTLGILFVVEVDGSPLRISLANLFFGDDGDASFTGSVPDNPNLRGVSFGIDTIALGLDGEPEVSNQVHLRVN